MPENHVADDVLEQYAMGRLSEADVVPLEEHLLVCQGCRERLAFLDDFMDSIRAAARATPRVAAAGHPH